MIGILCTLSDARLTQIRGDHDLFEEILEARHETAIPGLLDLGPAWDALDTLLSDRGKEAIFSDAILGRSGKPFGPKLTFGRPRLLTPDRVKQVSEALEGLGDSVIEERFDQLLGKGVCGKIGDKKDANHNKQLAEVAEKFEKVCALYKEAAQKGHSMLLVVV